VLPWISHEPKEEMRSVVAMKTNSPSPRLLAPPSHFWILSSCHLGYSNFSLKGSSRTHKRHTVSIKHAPCCTRFFSWNDLTYKAKALTLAQRPLLSLILGWIRRHDEHGQGFEERAR